MALTGASDTQTGSALPEAPEHKRDPGRKLWVRCLMQVLWPAFIGAAITVGLLFSLVDPQQIEWVHIHLNDSRQASYTLGFIFFWILYSFTCGITWYLATTETPSTSHR